MHLPAQQNKRKIFNDPVYGFISIPFDSIFDLIEHPYFQRLRRIKQTGLTHLVYPGALHTRFHHAMGTMHLMGLAIDTLRSKGVEITPHEAEAATIAILLHDIGHGPFSHALENSLVTGISHEEISALFMRRLNQEFDGKLSTAIEIFNNRYSKKFLHQLVASQLDMDRLDYLKRDSFFTGVSEGVISTDRIITMLCVANDELAVEEKGIYSIEKFIIARRLMYWQVYLHKTVLSAENLLVNILKRAKKLAEQNVALFCTPALHYFLYQSINRENFTQNPETLDTFALLDDFDVMASVKVWQNHPDKILSTLCKNMVNRNLYKIQIQKNPFDTQHLQSLIETYTEQYSITSDESAYFVFTGEITNNAYNPRHDKINILFKNGQITDIAQAADNLNISALSTPVKKYFLCYLKN